MFIALYLEIVLSTFSVLKNMLSKKQKKEEEQIVIFKWQRFFYCLVSIKTKS